MGVGMCCPQAIYPPNAELAKCRKVLQCLAIGLLPLAVLSIVAEFYFQLFVAILLFFLLLMSWQVFNWCSVLFFFLYCLVQLIQCSFIIVGDIEYGRYFDDNYIVQSIFLLLEELYFFFAIIISHYVYRVFKSYAHALGFIFDNQNDIASPLIQNQVARQERRPQANGGNHFRGDGIMIG